MKLIIAGSRTIKLDPDEILDILYEVDESILKCAEIVSGTANGMDKCGERFANAFQLDCTRFPADWDKYGKGAGHIRNKHMAEYADALLLIWTGDPETSRGSYNMKNTMLKLGKPVYEVIIKDNTNGKT